MERQLQRQRHNKELREVQGHTQKEEQSQTALQFALQYQRQHGIESMPDIPTNTTLNTTHTPAEGSFNITTNIATLCGLPDARERHWPQYEFLYYIYEAQKMLNVYNDRHLFSEIDRSDFLFCNSLRRILTYTEGQAIWMPRWAHSRNYYFSNQGIFNFPDMGRISCTRRGTKYTYYRVAKSANSVVHRILKDCKRTFEK